MPIHISTVFPCWEEVTIYMHTMRKGQCRTGMLCTSGGGETIRRQPLCRCLGCRFQLEWTLLSQYLYMYVPCGAAVPATQPPEYLSAIQDFVGHDTDPEYGPATGVSRLPSEGYVIGRRQTAANTGHMLAPVSTLHVQSFEESESDLGGDRGMGGGSEEVILGRIQSSIYSVS